MSEDQQQQTTINPNNMTQAELEAGIKNGNHSPADVAAAFFSLEYPRFRALLNELSQNELIRLCLNLAGNEFVPEANRLKSEKEKSAYYLGNQMVFNRSIMQLQYEMDRAEAAQKAQEEKESKTEEQTSLVQGENTNG